MYVYHSDLSRYVSDYCISIPRKSDMFITVIYHATLLSDTDTVQSETYM
jgi:hypothetical protein